MIPVKAHQPCCKCLSGFKIFFFNLYSRYSRCLQALKEPCEPCKVKQPIPNTGNPLILSNPRAPGPCKSSPLPGTDTASPLRTDGASTYLLVLRLESVAEHQCPEHQHVRQVPANTHHQDCQHMVVLVVRARARVQVRMTPCKSSPMRSTQWRKRHNKKRKRPTVGPCKSSPMRQRHRAPSPTP